MTNISTQYSSECMTNFVPQYSSKCIISVLEPLVHGVASSANLQITKEVKHGGLGVITAAIFLSGEMAGSGVLALPAAMIGTGNVLSFHPQKG